jgi:uncharacterized protein YwgA
MDPRHAVLIAVSEEPSATLVGRTLLQKKIYFASFLVKDDLSFKPHYYGPFSQEVADATDSLVSNRFIEEQVEVFPDRNMFGERRRHSYKITDDGSELLRSISGQPDVRRWREALNRINSQPVATDFNLLSTAAKVVTILTDIREGKTSEIREKAQQYGWNLTNEQINSVAEFLESLGLTRKREET